MDQLAAERYVQKLCIRYVSGPRNQLMFCRPGTGARLFCFCAKTNPRVGLSLFGRIPHTVRDSRAEGRQFKSDPRNQNFFYSSSSQNPATIRIDKFRPGSTILHAACHRTASGLPIRVLELDGADRAEPPTDLAWVLVIHVEEVRHHRLYDRFVFVIRRHLNRTAKDLQRATVPVLDDIVQGGKARIDEGPEILANLLAPVPIRNAKIASRVFGKA